MNKLKAYIGIVIGISLIIYLILPDKPPSDNTSLEISSDFNFLPSSTSSTVIHHNNYSLSYSEEHEQAEWVAYQLTTEHLSRVNHKRPYFIRDKKVKSKSADYKNYKNSGYTKGHLCPAGDRRFTKQAFDETFLTSNISPQVLDFNAGIWNRLEQKVRYWVKKDKSLSVITGGVLQKGLKKIGKEKVSVPNQFYKILLDYKLPEIKAIAFLIPHKESKNPLYTFVVSIDEIERLTGIDFFPELSDEIENKIESNSNYKDWSF